MQQIEQNQSDIMSEIGRRCVKEECKDIGKIPNSAKLTPKQVEDIFITYCNTNLSLTEISEKYGVKPGAIGAIIRRKNWRDVTEKYTDLLNNRHKVKDLDGEIWKDVIGYEGLYKCSNLGRIKSLERNVYNFTGLKKIEERLMRGSLNDWGYRTVRLSKGDDCKTTTFHRIIAIAFIPNPDNKLEVNHKNFNKDDNKTENLEWSTRIENCSHAWDNKYREQGLDLSNKKRGEQVKCSKLTEIQVKAIRSAHERYGIGYLTLSKLCGVGQMTIKYIIERKTWHHI